MSEDEFVDECGDGKGKKLDKEALSQINRKFILAASWVAKADN